MSSERYPKKYWWLILVVVPVLVAVINNLGDLPIPVVSDEIKVSFGSYKDPKRVREVVFNEKGEFLSGIDKTKSSSGDLIHWQARDGHLNSEGQEMEVDWDYVGQPDRKCWEKIRANYKLSSDYVTQVKVTSLSDPTDKKCSEASVQNNKRL